MKSNPDKKFWQVAKIVGESIKPEAPVEEKKVEEIKAPIVR